MVDWNVNISIVLTYVKIYTNASWRKVKTNEWHRTSQNTLFVDSPHVKTVAKRCAPSSTHRFREKTFIVSQNCFSLVFRFYFRLFSFIFRYLFTALLITCEQTININIKLLFWFSMPFDVQNFRKLYNKHKQRSILRIVLILECEYTIPNCLHSTEMISYYHWYGSNKMIDNKQNWTKLNRNSK